MKCCAKYVGRKKQLTEKCEAFFFKPNLNPEILQCYDMVMGLNMRNQIVPNLCESAGLSRKTCHCLRITCAERLFHIHRSNVVLANEKKGEEPELKVSNVLGPPNLENLEVDVPDEVLWNIPLPETEVRQAEKTGSCVLSDCVFNNCIINFGSLNSS